MVKVSDYVVDVLDASVHAKADEVLPDTARRLLLQCELAMCRRRWVNRKRLDVAHVGQVAEEQQRLDEPPGPVTSLTWVQA